MSAASKKKLEAQKQQKAALLELITGKKTVKGDELNPMSTRPPPKGAKDNTAAFSKSIADLFKSSKKGGGSGDVSYYGNFDETGADVANYGDFTDGGFESWGFGDAGGDFVFKKGGSVKKGVKKGMKKGMKKSTKKSIKKRAALRGQRSELRGS